MRKPHAFNLFVDRLSGRVPEPQLKRTPGQPRQPGQPRDRKIGIGKIAMDALESQRDLFVDDGEPVGRLPCDDFQRRDGDDFPRAPSTVHEIGEDAGDAEPGFARVEAD